MKANRGEAKRFYQMTLVYESDECCIWPFSRRSDGRAQIAQRPGGPKLVHRLVCEVFNGPQPSETHEAAHNCGNGHLGCINPRHVEWKTSAENKADQLVHGTRSTKLDESQVKAILAMRGKASLKSISNIFGVTPENIGAIYKGITWKHLQEVK